MRKPISHIIAVTLMSVGTLAFAQTKERVMIVTDQKNETTEISGYELECNRSYVPTEKSKGLKIQKGDGEITYPFDKIAEVEIERITKTDGAREYWECKLKIKLTNGENETINDLSSKACTYIIGVTKGGGNFRLLLCSAKKIVFR